MWEKNLMMRFLYDMYVGQDYEMGLADHQYPSITVIDGKEITVEVDYFQTDYKEGIYYVWGYDGFVLCFSFDNLESFQTLPQAYDELIRVKHTNQIPIILVGLKSDINESARVVKKEEAEQYASSLGCEYFEVSPLLNTNIKEAFQCISQKAYDFKKTKIMNQEKKETKEKKTFKKHNTDEVCLI